MESLHGRFVLSVMKILKNLDKFKASSSTPCLSLVGSLLAAQNLTLKHLYLN